MVEIGYKLSSEEHDPNELIRYVKRAGEVGFTFAMISDHYRPPRSWGKLGWYGACSVFQRSASKRSESAVAQAG